MSITLENQIVGAALFKPDLFKRYELEVDWLIEKKNKEVIHTLKRENGDFDSWSELLFKIKDDYPFTNWTEDSLEMQSFKYHELPDYEKGIELLKASHFKRKMQVANERYADEPTKKNLQLLKDSIQELDDMIKEKDMGELTGAVHSLIDEIENGTEKGIATYNHLDNVLGGGFRGGTLVTIGAGTGVGKTAFTLNLVVKMMENQPDIAIDFFTLEMSKKQMLDRFVSRLTGINSYNIRDPKNKLDRTQQEKVLDTAFRLSESGLRVHDSLFKLEQIEKQIRRRAYECKDKLYIPIVDYIGLIAAGNSNMPRYLQVGEITRTFKLLTNELNIPLIALSQLNRGISNRQDKRPTLADLRESGSVEQDSNVVMFLHRDEDVDSEGLKQDSGITELIIAKNREGFLSTIDYVFVGKNMHFEEAD